MLVNALVAYSHLACNLLGAQLNIQVEIHIEQDFEIYTVVITAALGSLKRLGTGCSVR